MLPTRQLLSPIFGLLTMVATSIAQQPAAPAAGQDTVQFKAVGANAKPRIAQGVLVTGVVGGKVMIKDAVGEIGYALDSIEAVGKLAPQEWGLASRAIEAGELDKAIPAVRAVAEKFRGLPTQWAQDANAALGSLLITAGKLSEAEAAISAFAQAYPNSGGSVVNVAKARLAAGKKQFGEAKGLAAPVVEGALKKKNVSGAESRLFGQAFFVLGQVAEGENKLPEAMEAYCRTVALFYQDRATVAAAQQRIDDLRKKGVAVP